MGCGPPPLCTRCVVLPAAIVAAAAAAADPASAQLPTLAQAVERSGGVQCVVLEGLAPGVARVARRASRASRAALRGPREEASVAAEGSDDDAHAEDVVPPAPAALKLPVAAQQALLATAQALLARASGTAALELPTAAQRALQWAAAASLPLQLLSAQGLLVNGAVLQVCALHAHARTDAARLKHTLSRDMAGI